MIILASKSPRRIELLQSLGLNFKIEVSEIDEEKFYHKDAKELNKILAIEKAKAVAKNNPNDIVIGSDTIVTINNKILGKPKNKDEARLMIKALSNNTHEVVTSICIIKDNNIVAETSVSKVSFYEISNEEIENYIGTDEPYDKAGGYAIQGDFGKKFIRNIDGDFYSIMGFPIARVYQLLKELM